MTVVFEKLGREMIVEASDEKNPTHDSHFFSIFHGNKISFIDISFGF